MRSVPPIANGERFDRYVIEAVLGEGGMGRVYRANDTTLRRPVALKLLRAAGGGRDEGAERLRREARAAAALEHVNAVVIHDVGEFEGVPYIAMELVEGRSLRTYVGDAVPLATRVRWLAEVARALDAAHARGLVHRDVKPENIMIRSDGVAKVLDFGIASAPGTLPELPPLARDRDDAAASYLATFSREGRLVGTPRYMAPEQIKGDPLDGRTDQFAWGVTAYELLAGVPPWAGDAQSHSFVLSILSAPPRDLRELAPAIPPRLERVILRALSKSATERYPSMRELLVDLEHDPLKKWRWAISAAVLATVAVGSAFAARATHERSLVCAGAEEKLRGLWDGERKSAVASALHASGRGGADEAWRNVEAALDRHAREWTAMRTESCEATRVTRVQSESLLDLRMRCLDDRLEEMRALTAKLSKPDDDLISTAPKAAHSLPTLHVCADTEALMSPIAFPAEPAVRAKAKDLGADLADVKALQLLGRLKEGERRATELAERARSLGYAPLLADVLQTRADFLALNGNDAGAVAALQEALFAAESGRDRRRAASVLAVLVYEVGRQQAHPDVGHTYARHAEGILRGLGGDAEIEASIVDSDGSVLAAEGRYVEAEKAFRASSAGRLATFGPESPKYGASLGSLGSALAQQDRKEEALEAHRQALEAYRLGLGEHHPTFGWALVNYASSLKDSNRFDEAQVQTDKVIALCKEAGWTEHPLMAAGEHNLALIADARGDQETAATHYALAVTLGERTRGAYHPMVGNYCVNYAYTLYALKRYDEAIAMGERALGIFEKVGNRDMGSRTKTIVADALLAKHAVREATALYESSVDWQEHNPSQREMLAQARFGLARALMAAPSPSRESRARALALAHQASDAYAPTPSHVAEVRAWLDGVEVASRSGE